MKTGKHRWLIQLTRIYERGLKARKDGQPQSDCPYKEGGGSVQRQRRTYWRLGWKHGGEQ